MFLFSPCTSGHAFWQESAGGESSSEAASFAPRNRQAVSAERRKTVVKEEGSVLEALREKDDLEPFSMSNSFFQYLDT